MRAWRWDSGFTVTEVLVASTVSLMLLTVVTAVLSLQTSLSRAQPAAIEIVERARGAVSVVSADLAMAGAGVMAGSGAGAFVRLLPSIAPRRIGLRSADPPGVARDDAVTMMFASNVGGGRLASPIAGGSPGLALSSFPPCALSPRCGLGDGDTVVVFDEKGQHDYYRLDAPTGAPATLRARQVSTPAAYGVGAHVLGVETHTYYYDASSRQLRHDDGFLSDQPVADGVVAMAFTYWVEDRPPVFPKPPSGVANCLYDDTGSPVPWSGGSVGLTSQLVEVPVTLFSDGPWCGVGENRFDADALRIRHVRVTLTLQAADELRASGSLFTQPGTSRSGLRLVPDLTVVADVAPRNLNAGR